LLCSCSGNSTEHLPQGTPVILVVIDTLRADHLSCYGYELPTSPALDAFASQATLFEQNSTQVNTTHPSLTSILTGLYSKNHGSYVAVPAAGASAREGVVSIAERLGEHGYESRAVISHPYLHIAPDGVDPFPGWQKLSTLEGVPLESRIDATRAANANARAFEFLDERGEQPLLLWVHYFDPHTDGVPFYYDAPPETRQLFLHHHLTAAGMGQYEGRLAALEPVDRARWIERNVSQPDRQAVRLANGRALYDAEIRYCDARFGELLDRLRQDGLYEDALIAVLADHGENLESTTSTHGALPFTHHDVFEAVSHVPLIIKLPGQTEARRIDALTQSIDVLPTILELLDVEIDPPVDGTSLVPLLLDSTDPLHERVFTESSSGSELGVKSPRHKLIQRSGEDPSQIFDWRTDPGELDDLYDGVANRVRTGLETWARDFAVKPALHIRVLPGEDLGPLEIELTTRGGTIFTNSTPPAERTPENNSLRWIIEPSSDVVELEVFLENDLQELSWKFSRLGDNQLVERLWIGSHPLQESTAIPLYNAVPGLPAGPIEFEITHEKDRPRTLFTLTPDGTRHIEMQVRYRWPHTPDGLTLLRADGWEPAAAKLQITGSLTTDKPLSSVVHTGFRQEEVLLAPRIDGRWPARDRVLIDGDRKLPLDEIALVFSYPPDARLNSLLGTQPARDAAPGSIVIWSTTVTGGKLDASLLDPETARALHALGYVDSEDVEGR